LFHLKFSSTDMSRVRFAISPLWETMHAVRSLIDPAQSAYHLPWLDEVRPALRQLDVAPLTAITPLRGYHPDFPTPAPDRPRPSIDAQLATVRSTPLAQVRRELAQAASKRGGAPPPEVLIELIGDPQAARDRIADSLQACWQRLVGPHWPRIEELLASDISHHSRILAEGGLERLFPSLSPKLYWSEPVLRVANRQPLSRRSLGGAGLVLQPSAFAWPNIIVVDDSDPVRLIYPARGIAELWQPVATVTSAALARLLGATRARLLTSLQEDATTTTLSRRHGLAPGTVSEHLSTLAAARLITAARSGRSVTYSLTPLGRDLLIGTID
jgi:DNA-binding transcriptional ArsR family regulator